MSNKISVIGKIWLIFLIIVAGVGVVTNLMAVKDGIIFLVSALACAGELFGLIYLIQGKGINYLYVYGSCYLVNGVLVLIATSDFTVAYVVGFIIGLFINISLTYLACKNTFKN